MGRPISLLKRGSLPVSYTPIRRPSVLRETVDPVSIDLESHSKCSGSSYLPNSCQNHRKLGISSPITATNALSGQSPGHMLHISSSKELRLLHCVEDGTTEGEDVGEAKPGHLVPKRNKRFASASGCALALFSAPPWPVWPEGVMFYSSPFFERLAFAVQHKAVGFVTAQTPSIHVIPCQSLRDSISTCW